MFPICEIFNPYILHYYPSSNYTVIAGFDETTIKTSLLS
jgi:hypothetical protein